MRDLYKHFLFILGVSFFANLTQAAKYYVSTTGKDVGNEIGSLTAPFKTIAKGSRKLAAGDILYIRKGTYTEGMFHNLQGLQGFAFRNGTAAGRTRYAAYPGEELQVLIKPAAIQHVVYIPAEVAYVEISGLILDGSNLNVVAGISANVVKISRNSAYQYPQHNLIFKNDIRNAFGGSAVAVAGPNEIIGNKIHDTSAYGIYASGPPGLLESNTIYNSAGYGIHVYDFTTINDWVIRSNILFSNGKLYRGEPHPAVKITRGKHYFYNNIIYGNFAGGVNIWGKANQTLVANNTIYGNKTYGILVESNNQKVRVINNLAWGNNGRNDGLQQIVNNGVNTSLQSNLTTDPRVINAATRDFRLRTDSPAINKGVTLPEVPFDFTKSRRPAGAYDIGAYEYGAASATTLSAPTNLRVSDK